MFIDCNCSVTDMSDDYPEIERTEWRKARKSHKCIECKRVIEPGEKYEWYTSLQDGSWSTFKTCLGCSRIREHLSPDGWYWGELAVYVEDCIGFNYVTGD